jgi:hypothetical protein
MRPNSTVKEATGLIIRKNWETPDLEACPLRQRIIHEIARREVVHVAIVIEGDLRNHRKTLLVWAALRRRGGGGCRLDEASIR